MDYDDNEFRSHNFQLIGEDNNKFPSGLRSFALPKIDLDEHLQAHLRFDSLIEPESLLGIHSQEESNWIEGFSTRGTVLEFGSSAAGSCSISRRNNVWSEATSSESVEMLLKSVGEDDMINKRTIDDPDTNSGLDCVNDDMDPSSAQDDSVQLNMVQAMKNDPALPPNRCSKNFSESNKDVPVVILPVGDTSKSFKHEESGCNSLEELGAVCGDENVKSPRKIVAEQCGLNENFEPSTVKSFQGASPKQELLIDENCHSVIGNNDCLDGESVERNPSGDHTSAVSMVAKGSFDTTLLQIGPSSTSVGILVKNSVNLDNQDFAEKVLEGGGEDMHDNSEALVTHGNQKIVSQILDKDREIDCQLLKAHASENCADGPDNSLTLEPKVDSPVLLTEGYTKPVVSEKSDGLLEDLAYQIKVSICETPVSVINEKINSGGNSIEILNADTTKLSSMGVNMDSLKQATERSSDTSFQEGLKVPPKEDGHHVESVISVKRVEVSDDHGGRKIETSLLIREEKQDSGNHLAKSSDSTENPNLAVELNSLTDTHGTQENKKDEDDHLGIHLPELAFDGRESASIQECAEDEVLRNDGSSLGGALNAPMKDVMENAHSPNLHSDDGAKLEILPSQDTGSLEVYHAPPLESVSCDVHLIPLEMSGPEKECTQSSNNINPGTDGSLLVENSLGASIETQSTGTVICAVEVLPAKKTQSESGDAMKCKENSLQSVTLSEHNSEPLSLEAGSANQNAPGPNCGSPTVISCSEHLHGEVEHQAGNEGLLDVPFAGNLPQVSSTDGMEKNKSSVHGPTENASEDDRSFTFEVGCQAGTSEKPADNGWKPFHDIQPCLLSQAEEGSSTPSGSYQSTIKLPKKTTHRSQPVSDEKTSQTAVNKNSRKEKSKSVPGSAERAASKRKSVKESPIHKQTPERNGNLSSATLKSVGKVDTEMQLEEIQQYSHMEGNGVKSTCATTVQTSSLPDLNTAASAASLFHQPFSDSQQVQLRAQIFVYGSLIQGIPPDEACMVSAFGNTDSGHSAWEGVWRTMVERIHDQKSPVSSYETPIYARSGIRTPESVSRSSPLHSKGHNTPASIAVSKGVSPAIFSSTVSLPSPLWSFSTCDVLHSNVSRGPHLDSSQMFSPSHGYYSSHVRPYAGGSNPWLSQSPSPPPWIASSQTSALGTSPQFPVLPNTETVQVTPTRDSSLQVVPSSSLSGARNPVIVPAAAAMQTISPNPDKQASANQKTRKRKKSPMSEAPAQVSSISLPEAELESATLASKQLPTSTGIPLPTTLSTQITSGHISATPPTITPTHFQIVDGSGAEGNAIFSEETFSKIEQAKLQAEDAASFAADAVKHSEDIWSQLAGQKNSGLASEIKMNLTSAAVAAAAAASVAKAAAAAAKVASDAALQAKMMFEEALISNKTGSSNQRSQNGHTDEGNDVSRTTPVSNLKGKDKTGGSCSTISVAKEAARRRIEAASAATKRAENLDAIVKAAELAAEAVSQAGAVVAMGDPLPFTIGDLVEAGPDGYWKARHSTAEHLVKTSSIHREEQVTVDVAGVHSKSAKVKALDDETSNMKDIEYITNDGEKACLNEHCKPSMENCTGDVPGPASFNIPAPGFEKDQTVANLNENIIQEGSIVEVAPDEDGSRGFWISARVLNLKDGKAFVHYYELPQDEAAGRSKEWIPLEGEADKAPRIRIPHSMTSAKSEGTRKRRRAAIGHYVWAVGDRVDARIRDRWSEGIVTEKCKEDETKLTVHFPAKGDSASVRGWNLRPSLIWNDGRWIEWSHPRDNNLDGHEGDTPKDKRRKLGRLEEKSEKLPGNLHTEDSRKPDESRLPILSAKDKIFSIGKNVREENNPEARRIKRTGPLKEGSRVVFGVPKPGKKRKFMDVSKHFVSDKRDKLSGGNDSTKFANYLIPQASRGMKTTSKAEPKGRQTGDSKTKVLNSTKSQNIQTRSAAEKAISSMSFASTSNVTGVSQGPISNAKPSARHEEKSEKNLPVIGSSSIFGTAKNTQQTLPGVLPSMKKSVFATETESMMAGAVTIASIESGNSEEKGSNPADNPQRAISDAIEPRRSNRRIQPTSRLLEGLQSSLIISKIPSVSHDKGARSSHRHAASSRGNTHA